MKSQKPDTTPLACYPEKIDGARVAWPILTRIKIELRA